MAFRTIDATATWQGDVKALRAFKAAYEVDCKGDIAKFQAAYGWTLAATELALSRAQLITEGFNAQRAGVNWWNNPRESGTRESYLWDIGHTAARKTPVQ